eukprot:jgi/Tetstr1/429547/TSEL_019451.t1
MGVASVALHVNTTNTIVGATVTDVTGSLTGSTFSHTYTTTANTTLYYWLIATDDAGNSTTQSLGSYTTDDTTAPTVTSATQAAGTPAATAIDLSFGATDNDPAGVNAIYVYQSTSATAPDVATVKASGVAKAGTATAQSFTGLTPATQYYAWLVATDPSGNDRAVTAFTPASVTTAADSTPPTITSYSLAAGGDDETEVLVTATIADSV